MARFFGSGVASLSGRSRVRESGELDCRPRKTDPRVRNHSCNWYERQRSGVLRLSWAAYLLFEAKRVFEPNSGRALTKGTFLRMRTNTIQTMTKIAGIALFFCIVSAWPLAAQAPAFDTSGNGKLTGTYYFRHVYYVIGTQEDSSGIVGDISEAVAMYGNISFDGNGHYTINNGAVSDSSSVSADGLSCYLASTTCAVSAGTAVTGTYAISTSGFGFLVDPITGDSVFGL